MESQVWQGNRGRRELWGPLGTLENRDLSANGVSQGWRERLVMLVLMVLRGTKVTWARKETRGRRGRRV